MFGLFLTPDYAPFAIAFFVMVGVGVIEAIGLGFGQLDLHADTPDAHLHGGLLDWLGLGGGLPLLIWLTSLLGCFTLAGLVVQQLATVWTGAPLHWGVAGAAALVAGGVVNRFASAGLSRIMPGYESSVIDSGDLLRRRGVVLEGVARRGHPARAKVIDQHGQAHYVMVEPHHDGDVVSQGESALLVRREGPTFFVLPDAGSALRPI